MKSRITLWTLEHSPCDSSGSGLESIGVGTVNYIWDLSGGLPNILEDSQGNRYVYGLDQTARINGSTEEYYLSDGLGSTTALTDDTGAVTDTYEYDVFGNVRAETGSSTNEFTYTGEQVAGTGLQNARRYAAILKVDPGAFPSPLRRTRSPALLESPKP